MTKKPTFWGNFYRYLRRYYLWHFRPTYVLTQLHNRKGECGRHGCCSLRPKVFPIVCRYYNKDEKSCEIFYTEKMPLGCWLAPIDEIDKPGCIEDICNFHWEDKKQ